MPLERNFQSKLIKELKNRFEGCIVLKNDPDYIQGFPDLTVLYKDKWALLECKRSPDASKRPNQEYWVGTADGMSFSRFIEPENKKQVLNDLSSFFFE